MAGKYIDLTGMIFGELTVLQRNGTRIHKKGDSNTHHALWLCQCSCGNQKEVITSKLKNKTTVSCGCHKSKNIKSKNGKEHSGWTGYKEISGSYFYAIQNSAKIRKKEFNITKEYIWEIYEKQNKKCAISGIDIHFCEYETGRRGKLQTASVDRIDSKKGYVKGNIQILHKDINYMKYKLTNEHLLNWVKIIYEHNKLDILFGKS